MKITREIIVFDAADLDAESTFWAGLLGGAVEAEEEWHTVFVDGRPHLGFQLAPLGARLLQPADDIRSAEGFQVYADSAGHPFCLCWG